MELEQKLVMELVHEVRIWIREQVSKEEKCQIWADNQ